jgi:hypothetical protein
MFLGTLAGLQISRHTYLAPIHMHGQGEPHAQDHFFFCCAVNVREATKYPHLKGWSSNGAWQYFPDLVHLAGQSSLYDVTQLVSISAALLTF